MQLNLEEIRTIARLVQQKGLEQIIVESTDTAAPACRLQLRRFAQPVLVAAPPAPESPAEEAAPQVDARVLVVTSPTVGIFRFSEGALEKGQKLKELQVVGVVESLKVPNEVRVSSGGVVETVFVEDGQGVEFGQPLLELQIDV